MGGNCRAIFWEEGFLDQLSRDKHSKAEEGVLVRASKGVVFRV